ncbi:homoserine kinase [Canibacter zhoujuaniae]|uniref:homoserine kinase n=1 Tax=Canibacter zhoujuaniae TaxID=2708343 RepID=UPI001420756A|nr:homoserine kinase [Canibacter zhoujuaniae]
MRKVRVRVPATSANLGPGFDTFGLGLSYADEHTAEVLPAGSETVVRISGNGAGELPTDASNLMAKSVAHVFKRVGREVPPLEIHAHNRIPHGRGMGSSGAAIVAGVMMAKGLLAGEVELSDQALLDYATELEGHPDNVAPALMGGLTIAWTSENGPRAKKLAVHRSIAPLVLVPDFQVSTKLARSLQPDSVPHVDAVFNVSRSSLLVAALTQSPDLLFAATEDKLHQNYRGEAMPRTRDLVAALRAQGFPSVVSGAGPSILVLNESSSQRLEAVDYVTENAPDWQRLVLAVDIQGATVEEVV